jgi:hypothetical protein
MQRHVSTNVVRIFIHFSNKIGPLSRMTITKYEMEISGTHLCHFFFFEVTQLILRINNRLSLYTFSIFASILASFIIVALQKYHQIKTIFTIYGRKFRIWIGI